jgi:hypothetical protein
MLKEVDNITATLKKMKNLSSWELFNRMFKLDQEIILITDEDKFEWGRIEDIADDGITLKRDRVKAKEIKWENVVFMSHDGFPVRKLPPSSSDRYVDKLLRNPKTTDFQGTIRNALAFSPCSECGEITKDFSTGKFSIECSTCEAKNEKRYSYRGGHPWEIEGVSSNIFNAGNFDWTTPYRWSNHPLEETVVMESKDGLGGQLWDLPAIFGFEQHVAVG